MNVPYPADNCLLCGDKIKRHAAVLISPSLICADDLWPPMCVGNWLSDDGNILRGGRQIVFRENVVNVEFQPFQIVECFPNSMPKELPDVLQKIKWSKPAKEVETWEQWY